MFDYLHTFKKARKNEIRKLREEAARRLALPKKGIARFREPFEAVQHLRADYLDCGGDVVTIGRAGEISDRERSKVYEAMRAFMPWRKGPFNVFGIDIDAEWRSERKWNRLLPALPDLKGKVVADIGCNNGYYLFRMAHHQPRLAIGFEPYMQHYFAFQALNGFAGLDNLQVELLGVEHIGLFEQCFDVVFLMGILYHRVSPLEVLRDIRRAMQPGGALIVESQAIPGDMPVALFPEKRYAKAPGTYFVPTPVCIKNWMLRAGFGEVEIFHSHPMSSKEQRRTEWMTFESYADFVDPANPRRTVEGYPAPIRVFLKGTS